MRPSPFAFLRTTYSSSTKSSSDVSPDLPMPPRSCHGARRVFDFSTSHDHDERPHIGMKRFDDAANMPYPLDLRTSAARPSLRENNNQADTSRFPLPFLQGISQGLEEPLPPFIPLARPPIGSPTMLPAGERQHTFFEREFRGARAAPAPAGLEQRSRRRCQRPSPPPKITRTADRQFFDGLASSGAEVDRQPSPTGRPRPRAGLACPLHHDALRPRSVCEDRHRPVSARRIRTFSLSSNILVQRSRQTAQIVVEGPRRRYFRRDTTTMARTSAAAIRQQGCRRARRTIFVAAARVATAPRKASAAAITGCRTRFVGAGPQGDTRSSPAAAVRPSSTASRSSSSLSPQFDHDAHDPRSPGSVRRGSPNPHPASASSAIVGNLVEAGALQKKFGVTLVEAVPSAVASSHIRQIVRLRHAGRWRRPPAVGLSHLVFVLFFLVRGRRHRPEPLPSFREKRYGEKDHVAIGVPRFQAGSRRIVV